MGLSQLLLVGAGGFLGSVCRYLLSGLVHQLLPAAQLPYGTLAVNVSGCLAIGVLGGFADSRQAIGPELRLFLLLGVLGGFTTFSTFGYETLALVRDGQHLGAGMNVALSLSLCLAATWLGYGLASVA
jgi:CrcB protein